MPVVVYEGGNMEKEWENILMLLCSIVQSKTDSMENILEYLSLMREIYGIGEKQFREIYAQWLRTGEIPKISEQTVLQQKYEGGIYAGPVAGLCRLLHEGIIDEKIFEETLWEAPYRTVEHTKSDELCAVGFFPQFPGCIGYADNEKDLSPEMKKALKRWISAVYTFWKEKQIINLP